MNPAEQTRLIAKHEQELTSAISGTIKNALSTAPVDRLEVEEAVHNVYLAAGFCDPVDIVWFPSACKAIMGACLWMQVTAPEVVYSISISPGRTRDDNLARLRITDFLTSIKDLVDRSTENNRLMLRLEKYTAPAQKTLFRAEDLIARAIIQGLEPASESDLERWFDVSESVAHQLVCSDTRQHWETGAQSIFAMDKSQLNITIARLATLYNQLAQFCSLIDLAANVMEPKVLQVLGVNLPGDLKPYVRALDAGGWWWPFDDVCLLV